MWLRIFKHLLPHGKAWRITVDKTLRKFFNGLTSLGSDSKEFIDEVWEDIFPENTRELSEWENQWALPSAGLTTQERRDRLDAAWKALGGQDPRYIEDTLQAHGFDVYVHEWWTPGTEPPVGVRAQAVVRSPLLYIRREYTQTGSGVECGEALAQCGEAFAQCGNGVEPRGYPLVNRILQTVPDIEPLCGEPLAACGEDIAVCGQYTDFKTEYRSYVVPSNTAYWPYFLYIGAADINNIAQVDPKRKEEFEALCLKICPAQQWLGILVEYV